jgi:hypothetical protein
MVNSSGQVAFIGSTIGASTRGVYLWTGTLAKVAREGDFVPGLGKLGTDYDGPVINKAATVAFVNRDITPAPLTQTIAAVLQKTRFGGLAVVSRSGDAVPGVANAKFTSFDDLALNDNGWIAFIGFYKIGTELITHVGLFLKKPGQPLAVIVKDGDPLPGTSGGKLMGSVDGPWINDNGDVAFGAGNIDCGLTPTAACLSLGLPFDAVAIFLKPAWQPMRPLVLKGDPGPASTGGTIQDATIGRPGLSNTLVGLKLEIQKSPTDPAALFDNTLATKELRVGGVLRACVSTGAKAPDDSTSGASTFEGFSPPAIAENGTLIFSGEVRHVPSVGLNKDHVYTCRDQVVTALALEGDPRPSPLTGKFKSLEEVSGESLTPTSMSLRAVFMEEDPITFDVLGVFIAP